MGNHKRDKKEEIERVENKEVTLLSLRPGPIGLPDGRQILPGKVFKTGEATAEWLLASFKEHIQRVD